MTQPTTLEEKIETFMRDFPCFDSRCDLRGNIPHEVGDGEWEAEQCQYCFEVRFPLRDRLRTSLTHAIEEEMGKYRKAIATILAEYHHCNNAISEEEKLVMYKLIERMTELYPLPDKE